jgi:hypothetical protein
VISREDARTSNRDAIPQTRKYAGQGVRTLTVRGRIHGERATIDDERDGTRDLGDPTATPTIPACRSADVDDAAALPRLKEPGGRTSVPSAGRARETLAPRTDDRSPTR